MSATELAAWWGAAIATLVFIWDIFKWKKSGPIVGVSVSPNMHTFGGITDGLGEKTFVVVEITNNGDRKTTITHLVGFHYSSFFLRLRKKQRKTLFVMSPALAQ
jgi:hypothetical protein